MTPTMTFELELILSFAAGGVIALCLFGWACMIRNIVYWIRERKDRKNGTPVSDEKLNN